MSDIAVRVEHLSKMYRLGVINSGTLRKDIQTWLALKLGKEHPNSKIGAARYAGDADHFWALKDVSFDIKKGDRVGIIGKNGAGKSTLLKILSRITAPTEGTVKIKGKVASLLEVGTGFHRELTGRENIYLNGAILGMKKRQVARKMDSIIDFSGIEHHIDTPVKRYSSGMFVRLAFAVAAHLDSDILIADEVLAVGDADFQKKALGKMQDLSTGEGRTVFFVSHNMGNIMGLCNKGLILEKGKIINESDNIDKLISDYLHNSTKKLSSYSWINSGEIRNVNFTPIKLQLEEEDGTIPTTNISANKKYKIKLEFEVKELNPMIDFGFTVVDTSGSTVFLAYPWDYDANYKPHIGINIVYFTIPKNILNVREYYISLFSSIRNREYLIDPLAHTVSITINVTKKIYGTKSSGVVSPLLEWSFN